MIISPEITSCGAARGIRNERLDDRIHRTPAGQNHHGLLVMMLRHPVHGPRLVRVAVVVGVAVLVADARQLGAPRAGHVAPAVAVHLLTLVRLIRCNDLQIFISELFAARFGTKFSAQSRRPKTTESH